MDYVDLLQSVSGIQIRIFQMAGGRWGKGKVKGKKEIKNNNNKHVCCPRFKSVLS